MTLKFKTLEVYSLRSVALTEQLSHCQHRLQSLATSDKQEFHDGFYKGEQKVHTHEKLLKRLTKTEKAFVGRRHFFLTSEAHSQNKEDLVSGVVLTHSTELSDSQRSTTIFGTPLFLRDLHSPELRLTQLYRTSVDPALLEDLARYPKLVANVVTEFEASAKLLRNQASIVVDSAAQS